MPDNKSLGSLQEYLLGNIGEDTANRQQPSLLDFDPVKGKETLDKFFSDLEEERSKKHIKHLTIIPSFDQDSPSVTLNIANSFLKGGVSVGMDLAETIGELVAQGINYVANSGSKREKISDLIRKESIKNTIERQKWMLNAMPTAKEYEGSLLASDLPQAMGSIGAFAAGGFLGAGLKLPVAVGASLLGASTEVRSLSSEAYEATKDVSIANKTIIPGIILGLSEGIPIGKAFERAGGLALKLFKNRSVAIPIKELFTKMALKEATNEGLEEFTQEAVQQIGENLTAQQLWDETRSTFEGSLKGGAIGFISGFALQMFLGVSGAGAVNPNLSAKEQEQYKEIEDFIRPIIDKGIVNNKEKSENQTTANNINGVLTGLLKLGTDNEILFSNDNVNKQVNKAAQEKARANIGNALIKTAKELKDVNPNILHATIQLNKNYIQDYSENLEDEKTISKIRFLSKDSIADMSPIELESFTKKIENKVLIQASKDNVANESGLDSILKGEALKDYTVAATLGLKGSTVDLLNMKYKSLGKETLESAKAMVENYSSNPIVKDSFAKVSQYIFEDKENIGQNVRDKIAKADVEKEVMDKDTEEISGLNEVIIADEDFNEESKTKIKPEAETKTETKDPKSLFTEKQKLKSKPKVETKPNYKVKEFHFSESKANKEKYVVYDEKTNEFSINITRLKELFKSDDWYKQRTLKETIDGKEIFSHPKRILKSKLRSFKKFKKFIIAREIRKIELPYEDFRTKNKNATLASHEDEINKLALNDVETDKVNYEEGKIVNGPAIAYGDILSGFKGTKLSHLVKYLDDIKLPEGGVSRLTKELAKLLPNVDIIMSSEGFKPYQKGSYSSNVIKINPEYRTDDNTAVRRTVAHELLHAFTVDFMRSNDKSAKIFKSKIRTVMNQLSKAIDSDAYDFNYKDSSGQAYTAANIKPYTELSEEEFIAYTFANEGPIRNALSKVPFGKTRKNLWNKIKEAIQSFFGEKISDSPSLLSEIDSILDTYTPEIIKFLGSGRGKVELALQRNEDSNIPTTREDLETDSWSSVAEDLDPYQEDELESDTQSDINSVHTIANTIAGVLGQDPKEYFNFIKNTNYSGLVSLIDKADKLSNNLITNKLKELYKKKYHKYFSSYEEFKTQFLINKLNRIQSIEQKQFASITFSQTEFGGTEVGITHYNRSSFKSPDGTRKSAFKETSLLETMMPHLERVLGLESGSLSVVYVNDFSNVRNGKTRSVNINKLNKYVMGKYKSEDFVSNMLNDSIESLTDPQGYNYLYLGNFSGKSTFPILRYNAKLSKDINSSLSKYLNVYNKIIGTKYQFNRSIKPSVLKQVIEDLWSNNIDANGNITNSTITENKGDVNKLMKRSGRFIQGLTKIQQTKDVLNSLDREITVTAPGEATAYNGIRLAEDNRLKLNTYVFNDEITDEDPTDFAKDVLGMPEDIGFLLNKDGIEISDGASYYIIGELDEVYKKVFGSLKNGALKNVYISKVGEQKLFLKHAMHGISKDSTIGKWMIANKVGLLTSKSAAKINGYGTNKAFELDLENFARIKEEQDLSTDGGALKQTFNGSGIVKSNSALSKIDPSGKLIKAIKNFISNKSINLQDYFANLTDEDFFDNIKEITNTPSSFKDENISRTFSNLLNLPIEEARLKFSGLVNYPMIAEVLRDRVRNKVSKTIENKTTGARVALNPNLGQLDYKQQVNPVIYAMKNDILNRSIEDPIFKEAIPDKTDRQLVKLVLALQKQLHTTKEKAKRISIKEKIEENRNLLKERHPNFKSITNLIDSKNLKVKTYINSGVSDKLDLEFDPETRKYIGNGRLKDGYTLISQDVANRYGIRAGDKVVVVVTPTDSMLGVSVAEVAGIVPTYGANKAIDNSKIIMNSEYIQTMVGKDFDIDTISMIPYNEEWTPEDWKSFTDVVSSLKDSYLSTMKKQYNDVFSKKGYPEGITKVDETNMFSEKVMTLYAQHMLKKRTDGQTKFSPLGVDFHNLSDKYLFDPSKIISERLKHTALSAINFQIDGITMNHPNWDQVHLLHLIMTNHSVDAPNTTAIFNYNGDLTKAFAQEQLFNKTWKVGKAGEQKFDFERKNTINRIVNSLFGRSFSLAKSRDYLTRDRLNLYQQSKAIIEQKSIFSAIKNKDWERLANIVIQENPKLDPNKIKEIVKTIKIDDIDNYPLFQMIDSMKPWEWPHKGLTFDDYLNLDRSTITGLIGLYPDIKEAGNRAFEKEFEAGKVNNETINTSGGFQHIMNQLPFYMKNISNKSSELLANLKRKAVAIAITQKEVSGTGSVAIKNSQARGSVFPSLFTEILKNGRIEANPNAVGVKFNVKGTEFSIFKTNFNQIGFGYKLAGEQAKGFSSEQILNPKTKEASAVREFILGDKASSLKNRPDYRSELNKFIDLQKNIEPDVKKQILKDFITDNVYSKELTRSEQIAFWLTSVAQSNDQKQAQNFVLNRKELDPEAPTKFQDNSLVMELMSEFEPVLFKDYMESASYTIRKSYNDSINSHFVKNFQTVVPSFDDVNFDQDLTPDSQQDMKMFFQEKFTDSLNPKSFATKEWFKFSKILKRDGYKAAYNELVRLSEDIATRMGLVENNIYAADLMKDLKKLSSSEFASKYRMSDKDMSSLDRAVKRNKLEAGNFTAKYNIEESKVTDQDKNNLESIFWILQTSRKPYLQTQEPFNAKGLNKLLKSIRAFAVSGPQRENKNLLFHDDKNEIIDIGFNSEGKTTSSIHNITLGELATSAKDYGDRLHIGLGEATLARWKGQLIDRSMNLHAGKMRLKLEVVQDALDYTNLENRNKFLSRNVQRKNDFQKAGFIFDQLSNYGKESIDPNIEMKRIFELAEGLNDRDHITVLRSEEPNQNRGRIVYSSMDYATYNKYDFINNIMPNATGHKKLRMLAALELRAMYDIHARDLILQTKEYLEAIKDNFETKYNDPDGAQMIQNLLDRFLTYYESMGYGIGQTGYGGKYGNYLPHQYSEHMRDILFREKALRKNKAEITAQVERHRKLLALNVAGADAEIASWTAEEIVQKAKEATERNIMNIKIDTPGTPVSVHFLQRAEEGDDYIKTDLNTHNDYINNVIQNVHNDLIHAESLVFKTRAMKAGNRPDFIEEGMTWYGDQTSNKFLSTRITDIDKLKKGQEVNFMSMQYTVYQSGGVVRTPAVISGVYSGQKNGRIKLHTDVDAIKREALFKVSKYEDNFIRLDTMNDEVASQMLPMLDDFYAEMNNLMQNGYVTKEDIKGIRLRKDVYFVLARGYNEMLKHPENIGTYKISDLHAQDLYGTIHKGTKVNRYLKRGSMGYIEGITREARNAGIIDGADLNSMQMRSYGIYKSIKFSIEKTKNFLNWLFMGGWSGAPAASVNFLGAYKSNRVDSWFQNSAYAKQWKSLTDKLNTTPRDEMSKSDKKLYDRLLSMSFTSNNDVMAISLAGANIEETDLLLKKPFWITVKELAKATGQAEGFQEYQKQLTDLRQKSVITEISNQEEEHLKLEQEIVDLNKKWAAHVEGIIDITEPLTKEREKEVLDQIEKLAKEDKLEGVNLAEKYGVTAGQALLMLGKVTYRKGYTSPVFGVGLQAKAEVQRSPAYGIAYMRALDYGYSEEEADIQGLRAVERNHALYDNANKQRGANTMSGKLMFMYSQYKYNMFRKTINMFKRAIPQTMKHRTRLTSWSDWPGILSNIKKQLTNHIDVTDEAITEMKDNKREGKVSMKDVNLSNFLMMRATLGLLSAQIGTTLLYGLANSDDPVTQSMFEVISQTIRLFDGKDDEFDQEALWAMQSAIYWAGLPVSLAISTPVAAAAIDWESATSIFNKGRVRLQKELLFERLPNTFKKAFTGDVRSRDKTLADLWTLDKMLGIKVFGYSKLNNRWIDLEDRFPLALNPLNYIPFTTPDLK